MITEIIIITKDGKVEHWKSIKEICGNKPWAVYDTLKAKKFPFTYKKVLFKKKPVFEIDTMSVLELGEFLEGKRINEI